jgi:hypothetical protein
MTIEVGADTKKEIFQVHKDLLCQKAPFFDKMFNGEFREGQIQTAQLPEDDPMIFKIFLAWVYQGALGVDDYLQTDNDSSHSEVFTFAEKYCITDLADTVIDSYCTFLADRGVLPNLKYMEKVCKLVYADSKLNLFFTRIMAFAFY